MVIRARSGPVRDALTDRFSALPLPRRRLHPGIDDTQLFGGVDLSATLEKGRFVQEQGLLASPSTLVLTMAERCPVGLAARLTQALDRGHVLIALDEGAETDEGAPAILSEHLAFSVDLEPVAISDVITDAETTTDCASGAVTADAEVLAQLAAIALRFGIDSLRAPSFALRAARAHAALNGRNSVLSEDVLAAVTLVYAHRATVLPETEAPPAPPDQPEPPDAQEAPEDDAQGQDQTIPDEVILDAVMAALPADLLARLATGATRTGKGAGAGARQKGNRRGRPLPPRAGRPRGDARLDLVATLRQAAPWQAVRRRETGREGLQIRPSDLRVKRYESRSDRLLIFVVDASGSQALTRLAEAKGAVELLLAQAYARRDHVALVSFRGDGAELLLPPTRSLVQTKRRLAGLPGGGGTPLAAGLKLAMELGLNARARGMTPTVALLSDGRANIALDGSANRAQAAADAETLARALRTHRTSGLVIDTGVRAQPALRTLAEVLGAPYLALPRADAGRLSGAVAAVLDG